MCRKNGIYLTVGLIVPILLIASLGPMITLDLACQNTTIVDSNSNLEKLCYAFTPHDPITINGDNNFRETALAEGWIGDGSAEFPYEIIGFEIDRGGVIGHCINISNTRVNFTIRNCNLTGASVSQGSGIYLNNVSYGIITNNTCNSNVNGIYLYQSHINTIANNTCTGNVNGINLYDVDLSIISDNYCSSNTNYGVIQDYCDSSVFNGNICSSNGLDGFCVSNAISSIFSFSVCNGNNRDGMRFVSYPRGNVVVNNTCNSNRDYGIRFYNDHNNIIRATVANNTCIDNDYGIQIASTAIDVLYNTMVDNLIYGIELICSECAVAHNTIIRSDRAIYSFTLSYTQIDHNLIQESYEGIILENSDEVTISNNVIAGSISCGIQILYGGMNSIFLNDIAIEYMNPDPYGWMGVYLDSSASDTNVTLNRIECGGFLDVETIHDDETRLSNIIDRNFYDDYMGYDNDEDGIGDTPYDIPGDAGNVDDYPLVYSPFAPEWVERPTKQILDYWSQPFHYDLNATAPTPITWQINYTLQFSIDGNGVIQSIVDLPVARYGLRVTVTNLYGVSISDTFQLTVQEITLPEWIVGPSDVTLDFGLELDYGLIATDQSGLVTWFLNDATNFNLTVTHLNVTGYENGWYLLHIVNATSLPPGLYPLNVSVCDPYGNTLVGLFNVRILPQFDETSPLWIVSPINETIDYLQPYTQRLGAWDESGIHHWWLNDTAFFSIDETGAIRNISSLEPGTYALEVRAYDPFDNYCSAIFVVTVLEPTPPTTTSTTLPTTTTTPSTTPTNGTSQNGFDAMSLLIAVGGISLAVIVVVILYLTKKKRD
jgi:parallel beta-helix repeat protein